MPRAVALSDIEKGKIIAYHDSGMSNRAIASKIGRHHKVISTFLRNPDEYGTKKPSGRPSVLSPRDKRRILTHASNSTDSCSKILRDLDLNVSGETIRRTINASGIIKQAKLITAPRLTDTHKTRRLEFARKNMQTNFKLVRIIWGFLELSNF